MQLEFGRGFTYNRPLRLNLLDLDYELAEQLVGARGGPRGSVALLGARAEPGTRFLVLAGQRGGEGVLWRALQVLGTEGGPRTPRQHRAQGAAASPSPGARG